MNSANKLNNYSVGYSECYDDALFQVMMILLRIEMDNYYYCKQGAELELVFIYRHRANTVFLLVLAAHSFD